MPKLKDPFNDMHFPLAGIDLSGSYDRQINRPAGNGAYARTTVEGINVRAYEPTTDRARGGQRPGIVKYIQGQVAGTNPIQEIASIVVTEGTIPGSGNTVTPFLGSVGQFASTTGVIGPLVLADYNPQLGLLSEQRADLTTSTILANGGVSARSFISGSGGPSYVVNGIPDNTAVTVVAAPSYTGTLGLAAPSFRMIVNGVLTQDQTALPFTVSGNIGYVPGGMPLNVIKSPSYHIFATIQTDGPFGVLAACAVNDSGTIVWSNTNIGTPITGVNQYPYRLYNAICGTYLIFLVHGVGLYRCDLADGTNYTLVKANSSIVAGSSPFGYAADCYSLDRVNTFVGEYPQAASNGTVIGVLVYGGTDANMVGVYWVVPAGTNPFSPTTGLAMGGTVTDNVSGTAARGPGGGQNLNPHIAASIVSDGTDFYVAIWYATILPKQATANCVVKKLNGTTGAVMWSCDICTEFVAGSGMVIEYITGLGKLNVYAPNISYSVNPTTGVVDGTGVIPGGNAIYAMDDAGSVTTSSTGQPTAPTTGPLNILVAVSAGTVKVQNSGSWQSTLNGTTALDATVTVIRSAPNSGKLYFADGHNYKRYVPATNTVEPWVASAGSLPADATGGKPRLICTWRGRTVLSGLSNDPRNWFMSAVGNPNDFDYSPLNTTPTQAVAGNNSPLGLVGDIITALIPYTDDVLIFGADHNIYRMQGDPMAGGQIDLVSDSIGIAWGNAWCKDPMGTVYFLSNLQGVYAMKPGQLPQRISGPIERLLRDIKLGSNLVRMQWDDLFQGLHIFVTPTSTLSQASTHYFWEARAGAWWKTTFRNTDHSPRCCHVFSDNSIADTVALIGSFDGYVRSYSTTALNDDGVPIDSSVIIGPLLTKDFDEIMLYAMQAILGANSGTVTYEVFVGATAEEALNNDAAVTGTWGKSRNFETPVRRSGHAIYLRLSASNPWALEAVRCEIRMPLGHVRRRGI